MPSSAATPFESCLQEAMELSRQWIPRWLDQLLAQLREQETLAAHVHERHALADACLVLQRQREPVARHWLSALADELDDAPSVLAGLSRRAPLSLDELELMGDEQVNQKVEIARVQQVVDQVVEQQLTDFTALLSSAQGLDVVSPDLNPLRPTAFIETFMNALQTLQIAPGVRARWLQAGARPLGQQLDALYRQLTASLEARSVKPAGYAVVTAPESRNFTGVAAGTDLLGDDLTDNEMRLTLDQLHQLLVGSDDTGSRGASRSPDPMMQAIAGEVVTLMLQRIAADQRLLPPVRDLLQDMKPALLELASTEPRFFADRHNPARRVLDAITARSLAFATEQDPGFQTFAREIRRVVGELRQSGAGQAERFSTVLDGLQRAQVQAERGGAEARGRALQTLVKVEQRNLLAEKVANEFRARSDFPKAPGPVRRFLTGVWAQVVAHARLQEVEQPALLSGDSDAKRYNDILTDLLWSSQLALASLNRPRLVKVIPPVLRTLREGLDAIDYPREKAEAFFQTLMGLHEAAYKTQRVEPAGGASAEPEISQLNAEDADLWMQRQEAQDTNLFDSKPEPTQPAYMNTLPEPQQRNWAEVKAELALRDATSLLVGSWFDLWQDGQTLRVQLTWASPHGTLFLFGTASGRSMSMTRRGVDRLIEQERLRVVADHSVVDEALDAVAQQALRNSGKT